MLLDPTLAYNNGPATKNGLAMAITEAAAARVLVKPLNDLYEAGKQRFKTSLTKWRNGVAAKKLAGRIASIERVKTFWQRDKEVPLSSFYYPGRVVFPKEPQRSEKPVRSLSHFPRLCNYVIQGTVGQGKSIFLRYLCVQELSSESSERIPIFLELRTVGDDGLRAAINRTLDSMGFIVNDELFDFYASSGQIVLLLDAFDELAETLIPRVVTELESLVEKYGQLQVLVTSRPQSAIQNSRHFRVVQLAALSKGDHAPFLAAIGVENAEAKRLMKAIQSSSGKVSELLTTPLMMTLLVIVYRAEQSIPSELPDFYERLFQTLFSKHDSSKPGLVRGHKAGLGERRLQHLFEAFCFSTLQRKPATTLTSTDFDSCFGAALQYVDFKCELEGFKHDITRVTCLMQEEDFHFHFIHKSVLEFYAASFIRSRADQGVQLFYETVISGKWHTWLQVLNFLKEIDTYRYILYFGIPSIERTCDFFHINPDEPFLGNFRSDLINSTLEIHAGLAARSGDSLTLTVVVSRQNPVDTIELSEIGSSISHGVFGGEPRHAHISEETIDQLFGTHQRSFLEDGRIRHNVLWHEYLTEASVDKIVKNCEKHISRILKRRREYQSIVRTEGRRLTLLAI